MISKLFNIKDEYQLEQLNRLFAKISTLFSIMMLALMYFEAIFDIERSYLSPYLIGVLLCVIVLACLLVKMDIVKIRKNYMLEMKKRKNGLIK